MHFSFLPLQKDADHGNDDNWGIDRGREEAAGELRCILGMHPIVPTSSLRVLRFWVLGKGLDLVAI
jgi:hypothetical protein